MQSVKSDNFLSLLKYIYKYYLKEFNCDKENEKLIFYRKLYLEIILYSVKSFCYYNLS